MDSRLLELLVCPICKAPLQLLRGAERPVADELYCAADRLAYPIRDGIPVMLESEARTVEPADAP